MIMPSSISSFLLILFTFLSVAILGCGKAPSVISEMIFLVSGPEILITATPDIPGPDERA